ncbi:MAG: efflux RND transporter periplasmic adaptor subunit [Pedosphaera parvula]|nr:efflux RND transporter periplasmic adaptor subunit [Pedosphaera parvula]
MKKWIILLLILGVVGWWTFGFWKNRQARNGESDLANRATTALVEPRNISFAVSAAGDIGPAEQVSVRPEVNGRIFVLPVDIGDTVKRGDPLFSLDDRDLQIEKESQEKDIERAKLQLEQSERNYLRSQQLFREKLISQELFEDTKTQYELSKNALARAEKNRELVNDRLRKTQIVAPFNCTVLTRPVSVGQAVSGAAGFNSGTEVLTIANLNEMVINAHINQADVTRLKVGQEVSITVEAVPGLKVTGVVERIAPQATIKNNIKGFAARILLKLTSEEDKRIRPGMTANIQIPVIEADNVLAVPLAAVFTEMNPETQKTERYVYVKKDGGSERRPVHIGISDFFFAEIQDGLRAGEVVMLEAPKEELAKAPKPPASWLGRTVAASSTNRPGGPSLGKGPDQKAETAAPGAQPAGKRPGASETGTAGPAKSGGSSSLQGGAGSSGSAPAR